jgi:hypothetical protein
MGSFWNAKDDEGWKGMIWQCGILGQKEFLLFSAVEIWQ